MLLNNIWVMVEPVESGASTTSLELISAAAGFASEVTGYCYSTDESLINSVAQYGVSSLVVATGLNGALAGTAVAEVMARRIRDGDVPDAIFFGATTEGRDCAAHLSAKLDRPVLTNVVNLELEDNTLFAEHAVFGGTEIARSKFTSEGPGIFVIRAKSFLAEAKGMLAVEVEEVAVGDFGPTGLAKVIQSHQEERSGPKLDEAAVVVSGGRGLGQPESYEMVEQLAELLNGAPGASRAIVDAGWVPYSYQVGQTGKTVKPMLYIACGISGATQHIVGMKSSKNIIAMNRDADAPIFSIADLGIVCDVHKVLPKLIEALRVRKAR